MRTVGRLSAVLILMVMIAIFIGFYFETNDDLQMDWMLRGLIYPQAETNLVYWYNFISHGLSLLYQIQPAVPWYGVWYAGVLVAFILTAIRPLEKLLIRAKLPYPTTIAALLILLTGFNSLILWNFTRIALLLASAAAWSLAVTVWSGGFTGSRWGRLWDLSMLIVAMLIRFEAAIVGLMIMAMAFVLAIVIEPRYTKKMLLMWGGTAALAFLVSGIVAISNIGAEIKKDRRTVLLMKATDFGDFRRVETSESTASINEAVKSWFYGDRRFVTVEYLESQLDYRASKVSLAGIGEKVVHHFFILIKNSSQIAAVNFAIMTLVMVAGYRVRTLKDLSFYLFYHAGFWIFLFAISVLAKMPNRLFEPMLTAYTFGHLTIVVFSGLSLRLPRSVLAAIAAVCITGLVAFSVKTYRNVKWFHNRERVSAALMTKIDSEFNDQSILITLPGLHMFTGAATLRLAPRVSISRFAVISGWTTWYPGFYRQLDQLGQATDFGAFFASVSAKNNTLLLSTDDYNRMIARYLKTLYHQDVSFTAVSEPITELTYKNVLNFYRMKITQVP